MDTVLLIIGIFGLGIVLVSAYVFTVAARTYVSDDRMAPNGVHARPQAPRSERDRRRGDPVKFPLIVNGVVIHEDRRRQPDRRAVLI